VIGLGGGGKKKKPVPSESFEARKWGVREGSLFPAGRGKESPKKGKK